MDDKAITGDDSHGINELKLYMQKKFQTKDLRQLQYFSNIDSKIEERDLSLSMKICWI